MIRSITRFVLVVTGFLGGYVLSRVVDWQAEIGLPDYYVIFVFIILGGAIGFVLGGIVGRELASAWSQLEQQLAETSAADLILGTVGLLVGLLVAFLAAQPLRLLQPSWLAIATITMLSAICAYVGVQVALSRRRDMATYFPKLASPEVIQPVDRGLLLDTSAVIDGRFVEVAELGYLAGHLRVPRFVLAELQTLADSADDTRRARGRRGLDLLATVPAERGVDVFEVDYPDLSHVDEKLMRLAVDGHATIVTVDYNLTKVARVRGIDVLNFNELAGALRPSFLPGDDVTIRVAKPGKEPGQGVGYLEDGTMVVIAEGRDLVGEEATVEVTSVLQTSAGRMIFARSKADSDRSGAR